MANWTRWQTEKGEKSHKKSSCFFFFYFRLLSIPILVHIEWYVIMRTFCHLLRVTNESFQSFWINLTIFLFSKSGFSYTSCCWMNKLNFNIKSFNAMICFVWYSRFFLIQRTFSLNRYNFFLQLKMEINSCIYRFPFQ